MSATWEQASKLDGLDWRIVGIPPNPGNPSFPNPGPKLGDDKSASFRLPQEGDFFPRSTRSTSMRTKVRGLKKPRGNSVRVDVSFYKNGVFNAKRIVQVWMIWGTSILGHLHIGNHC